MSYLTTFGYLLIATGFGSMAAGYYAAENGSLLMGYGIATVICGAIMWLTGRRYRR